MKTQLEFYMAEIEKRLERLQELTTKALMDAMVAFEKLDPDLASNVKKQSGDIDELADKVEDNVFETIARRQPVARDLRKLASYLQVAHNLYRVGRYAYKVAHITELCQGLEHYKELETLPHLAKLAIETIDIAMNAILKGDLSRIEELEKLEAETDRETEDMFQEISDYLRKMDGIERMSMFYVIVGRYFERAADHAFQIAERAIYVVTGEKRKLGLAYRRTDYVAPH
jgi:phosphate transport system protein